MLPVTLMALLDSENDKELFNKVVELYEGEFISYAYSRLNNFTLAEEAVSESLLRLARNFQKIHSLEVSKIAAYTVIIIRNVCEDIRKSETEQQKLEEKYSLEEDTYVIEDDEKYLVSTAVKKLPSIYRDVITLRYYYNLSIDIIANQLGISYPGVRKRLVKALKKLREEFENE